MNLVSVSLLAASIVVACGLVHAQGVTQQSDVNAGAENGGGGNATAVKFSDANQVQEAERILADIAARLVADQNSSKRDEIHSKLADLANALDALESLDPAASAEVRANAKKQLRIAVDNILVTSREVIDQATGDDELKNARGSGSAEFFDTRHFFVSFDGVTTSQTTFGDSFIPPGDDTEFRELDRANKRVYTAALTFHFRRRTLFEQAEEISLYSHFHRLEAAIDQSSWFEDIRGGSSPRDPRASRRNFAWDLSWFNFDVDLGFVLDGATNRDQVSTGLASQNGFFFQVVSTPIALDFKFYDNGSIPTPTTGLSIGPSITAWIGSNSEFVDVQYFVGYGIDTYFVIPGFYKSSDGDVTKTRAIEARLGFYRADYGVPKIERRFLATPTDPAAERSVVKVTKRGVLKYERKLGYLVTGSFRLPFTPAMAVVVGGNILIGSDTTGWSLSVGITFSVSDLAKALGA